MVRMGDGVLRWCFGGLLVLTSCLLPVRGDTAPILTLCAEQADVRPWQTRAGDGLNFRLLNQVARDVGVLFVYDLMAWPRCLAQLQAGRVDGAFAVSFKPERLHIGAYPGGSRPDLSRRLHMDRYVVLRAKGAAVDWDGKSFHNLDGRIGAQLGYSVVDLLHTMGVPTDEGAQSAEALLRKLQSRRVAAVAMLEGEARESLAANAAFARDLEILPAPLVEKAYYLLLSHALLRERPELAWRIWDGIKMARQSPAYQAEIERARSALIKPNALSERSGR